MSDEALQALLSGSENTPSDDLTGVPAVSGDDVVAQLQPEKVEEEEIVEEIAEEEVKDENPNGFLNVMKNVDVDSDEAYALGLEVSMQDPDGNKIVKTIGELKDEYDKYHEFNKLQETTENELASRKAELEGNESQFRMAQSEMLQMPQELYEVNARIVATEQHVNANQETLMRDNPGGLALMRQELQSLQYQRDNLQQNILNQRESVQQSLKDEQMVQQNRTLEKQTASMLKLIPEWSDSDVRAKESRALIDYGISKGFSEQQMTTIADPMAVKYMRDQMIRDTSLAAIKPNDDMPTPLRPQVVKQKATAERVAYNKLIKGATNSNDPRDKIDGIVALLQNQ